jgi:TPP-dependent pyruvate/acetoin dehydrogenase alpha subunit
MNTSPVEQLHLAMCSLPGVQQANSKFGRQGRPAWFVNGREFAHLHADDLVDLRLPKEVQARLKSDPLAHFRPARSEWLEFEFHSEAEAQHVIALAREAWAAAAKAAKPKKGEP